MRSIRLAIFLSTFLVGAAQAGMESCGSISMSNQASRNERYFCEDEFSGASSTCGSISDMAMRSACEAKRSKDPSKCDLTVGAEMKERCLRLMRR